MALGVLTAAESLRASARFTVKGAAFFASRASSSGLAVAPDDALAPSRQHPHQRVIPKHIVMQQRRSSMQPH